MKYKVDMVSGCWNFAGCKAHDGYGRVKRGGKNLMAHRYALSEYLGRPLKDGCVVLHSCDNPSCINPEHLSEGTQADNIRDCIAKGRAKGRGRGGNVKKADPVTERLNIVRRRAKAGWSIETIAKVHKWSTTWLRNVMQENGISIHSK